MAIKNFFRRWFCCTSDISVRDLPNNTVKNTHHKRDIIPKRIRNAVWEKYHGNSNTGICYVCGTTISRYNRGWHCSHVKADAKGGEETVANLRTCCPHCNLSMGTQNLYAYIRDKNMQGPGRLNVESYFALHNSQRNDKRTKIINNNKNDF